VERVLITGGGGFVGSHLTDLLLERGYAVRVFDNLDAQVHGHERPSYLSPDAEFIEGDVRNPDQVADALRDIDAVYHLAAAVGVGQSMYEIRHYCDANVMGTATLLEALLSRRDTIRKLVVASSMSIYGEGSYECPDCGVVAPGVRGDAQLREQQWEHICPSCGLQVLTARSTNEDKPLQPTSVYAVSKRDQEELCLSVGRAYDLPTVALRFFNIYGPRQALSNPYTGVAAIFSSRLLNGNAPVIFEDGGQSRDFIHVRDIARACAMALEHDTADYGVLNVGTGRSLSVLDIAQMLALRLNPDLAADIVDQYRAGDIRHCYADISRIQLAYGFEPQISFEQGIDDLVDWVIGQQAADHVDTALSELVARGLVR
jgi:dTDP-L-rhamnose 4-epimerase